MTIKNFDNPARSTVIGTQTTNAETTAFSTPFMLDTSVSMNSTVTSEVAFSLAA